MLPKRAPYLSKANAKVEHIFEAPKCFAIKIEKFLSQNMFVM
jgi:hypothetical protein